MPQTRFQSNKLIFIIILTESARPGQFSQTRPEPERRTGSKERLVPATLLATHRVEKPWGRHHLWGPFRDPPANGEPVGEIWFQAPGDSTPDLLVKYLFTSEKLSVQVHPDDAQAQARGLTRGKDECWLILGAEPDSTIAAGTKRPVDAETLRAAALDEIGRAHV